MHARYIWHEHNSRWGYWLKLPFKNREVGTSSSGNQQNLNMLKDKLDQKLILLLIDYPIKPRKKDFLSKLYIDPLDLSSPTGVFLCCYVLTTV